MTNWKRVAAAVAAAVPAANGLYQNGSVIAPCDSQLYCHGDFLKQIQLARPFPDTKTFVDMPALKSEEEILAAFEKLEKPLKNGTALSNFLKENFGEAGRELQQTPKDQLDTNPEFLNNIDSSVIKEFTQKVIDIWPDLTRDYVGSQTGCDNCPNSFLPVNRTFVVAGGRFNEPYYWDSYWILEGLLRTKGAYTQIARNIIENFLDYIDKYGMVPNGGRSYYLNRSQPPMLSQMVQIYIEHTKDRSILDRAIPLLEKEHDFFMTNRTVEITVRNKKYTLNRYAVSNNGPRPESFREDWETATNSSYYSQSGKIYQETRKLSDEERAEVWANLATGAESGWDYSSRWLGNPTDSAKDTYFPLRSIQSKEVVPVCLNSILYGNEMAIASFHRTVGNEQAACEWEQKAEVRSKAMHDLMWSKKHFSYFDFNLTSSTKNMYIEADDDAQGVDTRKAPRGKQVVFNVAQFYPFWMGSADPSIKNDPHAVKKAFGRVEKYLGLREGGIPATNFKGHEQWDQPNVWPPLMHVLMRGLLNTKMVPEHSRNYDVTQDILKLATDLGQRYLDSAFCTWYSTGGSTSTMPQLPGFPSGDGGIMFEKYADNSISAAGSGGEYKVVEGFGWTNGVLIWTVDTFENRLTAPTCKGVTANPPK